MIAATLVIFVLWEVVSAGLMYVLTNKTFAECWASATIAVSVGGVIGAVTTQAMLTFTA